MFGVKLDVGRREDLFFLASPDNLNNLITLDSKAITLELESNHLEIKSND